VCLVARKNVSSLDIYSYMVFSIVEDAVIQATGRTEFEDGLWI